MPAHIDSAYQESLDFIDASTGAAIDVSSYDFGMRFYQIFPSRQAPIEITEGNGIDVTNAATGTIVVSLTISQVNRLGAGSIRVELFKNYSDTENRTLIAEGSETFEGHRFDG